jgi:hypothetical protein
MPRGPSAVQGGDDTARCSAPGQEAEGPAIAALSRGFEKSTRCSRAGAIGGREGLAPHSGDVLILHH